MKIQMAKYYSLAFRTLMKFSVFLALKATFYNFVLISSYSLEHCRYEYHSIKFVFIAVLELMKKQQQKTNKQ